MKSRSPENRSFIPHCARPYRTLHGALECTAWRDHTRLLGRIAAFFIFPGGIKDSSQNTPNFRWSRVCTSPKDRCCTTSIQFLRYVRYAGPINAKLLRTASGSDLDYFQGGEYSVLLDETPIAHTIALQLITHRPCSTVVVPKSEVNLVPCYGNVILMVRKQVNCVILSE